MKMKRTLISILSIAAALLMGVSCDKESQQAARMGEPAEVTVNIIGDAITKATGVTASNEAKVNDLQVLIFDESGNLETYKPAGKTMSTTLVATSGRKTIWAVVNAPSLSGVKTLSAFNATTSSLTDNSVDSFVMTGSLATQVSNGAMLSITVKRLVARVSVGKIYTAFPDSPAYNGKTFKVKGIYMLNVGKTVNFALTGEPSAWYNKLGHYDAEADALLYDSMNVTLSNGMSHDTEHVFYPYPNPSTVSVLNLAAENRGTWSPRRSIVTIEVEFDGVKGYYPIELPCTIERNKKYVIEEVKITRSPGDLPYVPIMTQESTIGVIVSDWENGLTISQISI